MSQPYLIIMKFGFVGSAVFWAFASYFGTFYGGFFFDIGSYVANAFSALAWETIANFLRPIFGVLSIKLSLPYTVKKEEGK